MTKKSDLARVIDAIDHLRSRKNRPNLPAIARILSKTHGFPSCKTIRLVDELQSQNKIKEIVYKGNVSFRNMLTWQQPKWKSQKLDTKVSSSLVTSTMLRLMIEDLDEEEGGIPESKLQAALIEQLDGAVQIQDIRKKIQDEVDKGTLERNGAGDFVLCRSLKDKPQIDLDMDDPSMSIVPVKSKISPKQNGESPPSRKVDKKRPSLLEDLDPDKEERLKKHRIQNLCRSIEKVVQYSASLEDKDMTEPAEETTKKIKKVEITCQLSDQTDGFRDNKRRRIIRKKQIYDPSEFEVTPVVRRHRKRASSVLTDSSQDKVNGKQASKGNKSWNMSKDSDSLVDMALQQSCDSVSDNLSQDSIKEKPRGRGRPPSHVNKKCSICSVRADKKEPDILSCSLCLNIAHKICIKVGSYYEGSKKWRCEDCKNYNPVTCSSCEEGASKKQVMLLCDFCEEFFHANCHDPPVHLPLLEPLWRCSACPPIERTEQVNGKIEDSDEDSSEELESCTTSEYLPSESQSPKLSDKVVSPSESQSSINSPQDSKLESLVKTELEDELSLELKMDTKDELSAELPIRFKVASCVRHKPNEPIPTVDDWTVQQVSDYFLDKFGPIVAEAFTAQDIDGKVLKQMSRQFVTDDLGLQFGTALKVLYYVKKIQLGTNLLQELWA